MPANQKINVQVVSGKSWGRGETFVNDRNSDTWLESRWGPWMEQHVLPKLNLLEVACVPYVQHSRIETSHEILATHN